MYNKTYKINIKLKKKLNKNKIKLLKMKQNYDIVLSIKYSMKFSLNNINVI